MFKKFLVVLTIVSMNFLPFYTVSSFSSSWGEAMLVENNNLGDVQEFNIAMNDSGLAMSVWEQHNGLRYDVFASKYDGSVWSSAVLLENNTSGDAKNPQVTLDNSGNAWAMWRSFEGGKYNLFASKYDGSVWSSAVLLENNNLGDVSNLQLAIDAVGNPLAIWQQTDGSRNRVWFSKYVNNSWQTAQVIANNSVGDSSNPSLSVNASGKAMLVWQQTDGVRNNIWASKYDGNVWSTAFLIENNNIGNANNPKVYLNDNNQAAVVWEQFNGNNYNVWASKYNGSTWSYPVIIQDDSSKNVINPQVVMSNDGNVVAVWGQLDSTTYNIWSNDNINNNWGMARNIETQSDNAFLPQLVLDNNGNALAVWFQSVGNVYNVFASRYVSNFWTATELVAETSYNAWYPKVAMSDNGKAIVIWKQHDNIRYNLWSSNYVGPVISNHDISGTVWHDHNQDGVKNDFENIGLKNVEVQLYKDIDNSNTLSTADVLLQSVFSDNLGNYVFDNLASSNYLVVVNDTSDSLKQNSLNGNYTYGLSNSKIVLVNLQENDLDNINFGFVPAKVSIYADASNLYENSALGINTVNVTVLLSVPTAFDTIVLFSYGGVASPLKQVATAGIDYSKTDFVTIAKFTTSTSFQIKTINDSLKEYPEFFDVEVSNVINGTESDIQKLSVNIADDECKLSFGISNTNPTLMCIDTNNTSSIMETKKTCKYVADPKTGRLRYICQ